MEDQTESQSEGLSPRARLRIALEIATGREGRRRTVGDFAEEHDVSTTMLYDLLNGNRTSERLEEAVESFIDEQIGWWLDHCNGS